MFNLLITFDDEAWQSSPYEFDKNRVAIEYTVDEISERYKFLNEKAISELKKFPTLFVIEGEDKPSKIGYITDIKLRATTVVVHFEIDPNFPELPKGTIESLRIEIDLGRWELSRTHWAIKDENLFDILLRRELITQEQVSDSLLSRGAIPHPPQQAAALPENKRVFIVHGHDEIIKMDMANFISDLGLEPIILHQQASSGRTIIEKIEAYSDVGFAVVLYTPCDSGAKKGDLSYLPRARQNVVFEHGYLIAKLGRSNVTAMVKGHIETPNDISGVIYINLDEKEQWKSELIKEMQSVGFSISN